MPYETKKRAEQMAAREALLLAGVHNPEDAYKNSRERKEKLKRNFAPEEEFNKTSLVHCHGGYGMGYPNLWCVVMWHLATVCTVNAQSAFFHFSSILSLITISLITGVYVP